MSRQEDKYHLNIAGEFFVAAQLQRLGISASVTYGNAKKADIVAISEDGNRALNKKYLERRGVERGNKPGVVSLARKDIEPHRNAWDKITDRMKT